MCERMKKRALTIFPVDLWFDCEQACNDELFDLTVMRFAGCGCACIYCAANGWHENTTPLSSAAGREDAGGWPGPRTLGMRCELSGRLPDASKGGGQEWVDLATTAGETRAPPPVVGQGPRLLPSSLDHDPPRPCSSPARHVQVGSRRPAGLHPQGVPSFAPRPCPRHLPRSPCARRLPQRVVPALLAQGPNASSRTQWPALCLKDTAH